MLDADLMTTAGRIQRFGNANCQIPPSKIVYENCNEGGISVDTKSLSADQLAVQGKFFCGQDYDKIKEHFRTRDELFVDPFFPPSNEALFLNGESDNSIVWKRIHDISESPEFIDGDGGSRFDVKQGELGDCWLLAAIANLTMNKPMFKKVVPCQQKFRKSTRYAGVFYFNIWYYGQWIEIVVDDYLPTRNGQLIYMRSVSKNEFWSALLEKAYAKLHGCYASLKGGLTVEAMVDFTGGCSEIFQLGKPPQELFNIMLRASTRHSMMACSIEPDPHVFEAKTANGLVRGHAYSVIKLFILSNGTQLLRIRNPWGNDTEWNGDWSDDSRLWERVSEQEKKSIQFGKEEDGEFHMSMEDFLANFHSLELCHVGPDLLEEGQIKSLINDGQFVWFESRADGRWRRGRTAGGCRNHIDTFALNPQYFVELKDSEQDEDDMCSVVVSLMQKGSRGKKASGCLTMGFSIYRLPDDSGLPEKPLDKDFFRFNAAKARSKTFVNLRELTERFVLEPGNYVIIPSTFKPHDEGDFLLREELHTSH